MSAQIDPRCPCQLPIRENGDTANQGHYTYLLLSTQGHYTYLLLDSEHRRSGFQLV